ncbi:saccharopine dehydrogenase [Salpingoeca rosetta]|uniref:Saccharopine dehydrogenase [NAD(+), L-lysine-forming] n=1 Tax=Salpingoeca rosetta (strain ATCC 50818 / BSB-021) TaxID=946362 RepID=F2TX69_SALR5|nr:saccharopine dehydrogenase [Salpingoeca rosetta]EGD75978.1 saccharopine dehydrogenase [Salpingoeca rosetta]|eukprot:XP_004998153.1 saccharopine dehydrogenase [Salpingoeca rosetta]
MAGPHLWLRAEVKPSEHRTALTPEACKELIGLGFKISVESSTDPSTKRCYTDEDYKAAGCEIVETGSWPTAPKDAYIVGLKELPEDTSPLEHTHIYFGHCYKGQGGWKELLARFRAGGGKLLDLEFLTDATGPPPRSAFGYMAGYTGAFVGLDVWCHRQLKTEGAYPSIDAYPNEEVLFKYIKPRIQDATAGAGGAPRVLVMGALGRCGRGACDFLVNAGIPEANILRWDLEETKKGGPFPELLDVDIFVNCIYLAKPIPPFITREMLDQDSRRLSVVVDVSCDTTNPHNPIPFADKNTTFTEPTFQITPSGGAVVDVVTIDHLPTLLPKESSDRFAADLLPTIKGLAQQEGHPVWGRALELFHKKMEEAQTA